VFAKDLLFCETILILVGDGAHDAPPYKRFLRITNPNPVGVDSFVRPLNKKITSLETGRFVFYAFSSSFTSNLPSYQSL